MGRVTISPSVPAGTRRSRSSWILSWTYGRADPHRPTALAPNGRHRRRAELVEPYSSMSSRPKRRSNASTIASGETAPNARRTALSASSGRCRCAQRRGSPRPCTRSRWRHSRARRPRSRWPEAVAEDDRHAGPDSQGHDGRAAVTWKSRNIENATSSEVSWRMSIQERTFQRALRFECRALRRPGRARGVHQVREVVLVPGYPREGRVREGVGEGDCRPAGGELGARLHDGPRTGKLEPSSARASARRGRAPRPRSRRARGAGTRP